MKIQAIAAAALLSACTTTEYVFTPPETAEHGEDPVNECESARQDADAVAVEA